VKIISLPAADSEGPSPAELAEIEQDWPLIAAELDLLDAQIAYINAGPYASVLDRRRVRRAERRVLAVSRELDASDAGSAGAA
jgi:cob(I)alamin adenosyltransferase